ncbi:hypothetical protein [Paenibacillus aquistagni]|uniref:hypothetical protein n=1 Tax=Paenibacillus aquistagni TaxID=1852522 RepID=UPI000B5021D8|nr:hypothetical protein [Paenibacillus aquistagni]
MKKKWMATMIAAAMLGMQGCSIPAAPIDLIQAPAAQDASEDENELRQALPEGSRILLPLSQEEGSGIMFGDIDGDQAEEAIVVFEDGSMNSSHQVAMLKKVEGQWKVVWDTKGAGNGLDFTQIKDVDHDGIPDVVLGWVLGGGEKGLDVYTWKDHSLELLHKKGYRDQPLDSNEQEISLP